MESNSHLCLHGPSLNIVKRCGPALGDILDSKFGCVATFHGVDFESDSSYAPQKKSTVPPQERFNVVLNAGVKVSVWKGDLTNLKVDAVVNAANEQLSHCGGLALALSEAGGPQIQQDSTDYIKKHGQLTTGCTTVTDAGLLPCTKIIHAVGPQLSRHSPDVLKAEPLLKKVIRSILDTAKERRFKTVAIPAISSGLFNYPLDQCAHTIVLTVKHYYEHLSPKGHVPDEIMLVNNDEPTVYEMEMACRQILSNKISYSQAAGSNSKRAARSSALTVKIGNVLLTLKKGKIEEEQTNVIVNTMSSDRDLQKGAISKALAKKAGHKMQSEVQSYSVKGNVIATKGYNLHCEDVYHIWFFEGDNATKQETLFQSVLECLHRAVSSGHRSISFPAIGTGFLCLYKPDVALKMSQAVTDFAQKNLNPINVNFVIFPADNDTYKAFETQMKRLQQNTSHPSSTHVVEHRGEFQDVTPPIPQISLLSRSKEVTHEAEQWLRRILFNSLGKVEIYNNFIQHFGEKEYQQLSSLTQNGVSIQESFVKGRATITIKGYKAEEVALARLQVEAMLCSIQKEFTTEEENTLFSVTTEKMSFKREVIDDIDSNVMSFFRHQGLQVLKMEKVENPALKRLFELKKEQLKCLKTQTMIQRIPAQFCEMVCHIGFHAEYAPPEDPAFGEGIYFARTLNAAMEMWKWQNEEYFYFVEAEVLTGKSTHGKPGLILPPAVETDPQTLYDSVSGGADIAVIFSSYQALPKCIVTCKRMSSSF